MRTKHMLLIGAGAIVAIFILILSAGIMASIFQLGSGMQKSPGTGSNDLGPYEPPSWDGSGEQSSDKGYYPTGYPTANPTVAPDAYSDVGNRKVIMTAYLKIETGDFDRVVDEVRAMGPDHGGYVQSSSLDTVSNRRTCTITLKVPNDSYESVVAAVKKLGAVKTDRATGSDVTGTYVDLNARLGNLKATESRLLTVLGRANSTTDILAVEKELSRVRGDIESITAQLDTLNNKIDFATITVYVTGPEPVVAYDWGLGQAFTDGVHMFVGMIGALIILTGFLIPLALYLVLCVVVIYLCYKGAVWAYRWFGGRKKMATAEEKK